MTQKELIKKVALLKSGVGVEISGDTFFARQLPDPCDFSACAQCDLDSICSGDVYEVCCAMESSTSHGWLLQLAHPV